MTATLTIGALAKRTGTKVVTIRYYEAIGLLPEPARTRGNFRSYSPDHLQRLAFIRKSRDLGFTLPQVRALLDLANNKKRGCKAVDRIAREHLADVDQKIANLTALRRELGDVISQCRQGTIAECRIVEALSSR